MWGGAAVSSPPRGATGTSYDAPRTLPAGPVGPSFRCHTDREESDMTDYGLSAYAPRPMPSDDRIDAAALDVATLARVPVMEKGYATFDRDTLVCTGWWDPRLECDHGGANEIEVRVPYFSLDEVDPDWS